MPPTTQTPNPFAPTTVAPSEKTYGDAVLKRSGFLYRVFEIDRRLLDSADPVSANATNRGFLTPDGHSRSWTDGIQFVYNGWWFVQRLTIDGQLVWWKISWLRIENEVEIQLPESVSKNRDRVRLSIGFGRGLHIKRMMLTINGRMVYEEIR